MGDRLSQTVNGVTTQYTLDLNTSLTQVLADGTSTYLYGPTRIGEKQASGFTYHLPDALGSVRQLADATANVTLTRSYAPYGDTLTSTGAGATAWQFAGEQRDASGLTFLRARYLSTTTGRFLTQDEWPGSGQMPATLHPYLYGLNNPVRYTDPSGHCISGAVVDTILCGALIGGTIGAVAGGVGYWATHGDGNWNQRDFANAIVVGGVSGIVGGAVGGGIGALFGTATLGQAIVGGAVSGAGGGGATQIATNLWRRYAEQELCVNWYDNVLEATVGGAVIGGTSGGVGYGISRIAKVAGGSNSSNFAASSEPNNRGVLSLLKKLLAKDNVKWSEVEKFPYHDPVGIVQGSEGLRNGCVPASCKMLLNTPLWDIKDVARGVQWDLRKGTLLSKVEPWLHYVGKTEYTYGILPITEFEEVLSRGPLIAGIDNGGIHHAVVVDAIEDGFVAVRDPLTARGAAFKVRPIDFLRVYLQAGAEAVYIGP